MQKACGLAGQGGPCARQRLGKGREVFNPDNSGLGSDSGALAVEQNEQICFRQDWSCWEH